MPVEAIKLHFTTPLHIGRGATDLDKTGTVYHSDAMKSALYATGLPYYSEWQERPDAFFNEFRISSLFPFAGNELFLPKPYYAMHFSFKDTGEEAQAKKAKRVSFVSASLFKQWVAQKDNPVEVAGSQLSPGGSYLFSAGIEAKAFLHAGVQQRVQVPAESEDGDSRPFYFDRLYFEEDAGLYFLVQFNNQTIRQQVLHALSLLADLGIGTDRTVGNGLFSFQPSHHISAFDLPAAQQGSFQMNLGTYLPTEEEIKTINLDDSFWQLVKRGGYMGGSSFEKFLSLRKNSIYFFAEGSVFATPSVLNGKFVDLRPAFNDDDMHPVYRCGQPLFLTF